MRQVIDIVLAVQQVVIDELRILIASVRYPFGK
jgi:hypothetical protein